MLTKQIEQAVAKYAEAAKWEHKCRVQYEAAMEANPWDGSRDTQARETEALWVHTDAELTKDEALSWLTELLLGEP